METQFEIISRLEKKHYEDYYRAILKNRTRNTVIYFVLCVLFIVLGCLSFDLIYILWGVLCAANAVKQICKPSILAKRLLEREKKFTGNDKTHSVTKFADMIYDEDDYVTSKVPYSKIESIYITPTVIVLRDVRKNDIILDRNGFTKGSLADCLLFIQNQCPQLILPNWQVK